MLESSTIRRDVPRWDSNKQDNYLELITYFWNRIAASPQTTPQLFQDAGLLGVILSHPMPASVSNNFMQALSSRIAFFPLKF